MDRNGILWCRENIPLIVSWLLEEVSRRKAEHPAKLAEWEQATAAFAADPDQPHPGDKPTLPWRLTLPDWLLEKGMRAKVKQAIRRAEWASLWGPVTESNE
jgi:hypothetical protein